MHRALGEANNSLRLLAAEQARRADTEREITQLNAVLEARVRDRTAELAARVAEVERLNGEQQALMRDLRASQLSADRTAARLQEVNASLLAANQELEAFSHTVSHDLRAPLRNITGFLELLHRRTGGKLDPEAERFVTVVSTEATRMGHLIDDLLTFSRIGRTEIKLQPVDLAALVAGVREDLRLEAGERPIEWCVGPLPAVRGDAALLRQVVANLLGNALKFTRNSPAARIEIGASPPVRGERTVTVFVRDNGAGFNPKYLDKLFGVFQRLHNPKDFEGTGIGLANVKRIITRHGGRVWAEGQVERGATFYLTLDTAQP
jgi:light-regulated signal transduction histidine kinase (bacteriophytochrome)